MHISYFTFRSKYCTSTIKYTNVMLQKWGFLSILKYLSKLNFMLVALIPID